MKNELKYRSFSVNPFRIWIIIYIFFFIPVMAFVILMQKTDTLVLIIAITLLILAIYFALSYSELRYDGQTLSIKRLRKNLILKEIQRIETWWSYDLGISDSSYLDNRSTGSRTMSEGAANKTKTKVNKINLFARIESHSDYLVIYEQILGDKFPNNHSYQTQVNIDKKRLLKIWDVDSCLVKLNLGKT